MKMQQEARPRMRRCSQCQQLFPFGAFSNQRWNNKDRVCCNCKPFTGRTRAGRKVSDKARAETSENCRAWPLDGKVDKEATFWRYCNARKNLRPVPDECHGCKIKVLPSNVGIMK